ncbi:MAG: ribosome silencing factor [Phycisphaerae bacterium]|nr:ribosome silencing factor [Phycisphaerae bacterium]NIP51307.1 ribosome silencing factor [Phycisphaerae bacterium]NIX27253.1 ribosome silencing factor [Phycisphaerae bacterium]
MEGLELAHVLVDTILDKKGSDILLLDLRDEAIFTDYFLICNGESKRQLQTLADSISEDAKAKADVKPWGKEGEPESGWMLIDYGDLIVHLFHPDTRHYYDLEDLWQNAHVVLRMQ